jgi:hypothetical protein
VRPANLPLLITVSLVHYIVESVVPELPNLGSTGLQWETRPVVKLHRSALPAI